jgi:D-alanine-D-alanine ligase
MRHFGPADRSRLTAGRGSVLFRIARMLIALLHNADHDALEDDPGREARQDVLHVAGALANALTRGKRVAVPMAVGAEPLATFQALGRHPPDLVVNLCESVSGDSRGEMAASAMLEMLAMPYTGSGPLALGLALHKDKAKELLLARGVPTPAFAVISTLDELAQVELPYPLIVKPVREDASVGVSFDSVVHDPAALRAAVEAVLRTFHQPALVERFIPGREVYVSLLGNEPRVVLPLTEIRFGKAFEGRPCIVSYRAKWETTSPECRDSPSVPCSLPATVEAKVVEAALAAFDALGCRDYGRVDIRLTTAGDPYVIDINPNCDLHPQSGYARSAAAAGMDYAALGSRLVEVALERTHGHPSHRAGRPSATRRPAGPDRELLSRRSAVRARGHRPGVAAE